MQNMISPEYTRFKYANEINSSLDITPVKIHDTTSKKVQNTNYFKDLFKEIANNFTQNSQSILQKQEKNFAPGKNFEEKLKLTANKLYQVLVNEFSFDYANKLVQSKTEEDYGPNDTYQPVLKAFSEAIKSKYWNSSTNLKDLIDEQQKKKPLSVEILINYWDLAFNGINKTIGFFVKDAISFVKLAAESIDLGTTNLEELKLIVQETLKHNLNELSMLGNICQFNFMNLMSKKPKDKIKTKNYFNSDNNYLSDLSKNKFSLSEPNLDPQGIVKPNIFIPTYNALQDSIDQLRYKKLDEEVVGCPIRSLQSVNQLFMKTIIKFITDFVTNTLLESTNLKEIQEFQNKVNTL